jgi:hypothetical protein
MSIMLDKTHCKNVVEVLCGPMCTSIVGFLGSMIVLGDDNRGAKISACFVFFVVSLMSNVLGGDNGDPKISVGFVVSLMLIVLGANNGDANKTS